MWWLFAKVKKEKGDHGLGEFINNPLLLIDLIPQASQLLVMEAAVRLALLTKSFLEVKKTERLKRC